MDSTTTDDPRAPVLARVVLAVGLLASGVMLWIVGGEFTRGLATACLMALAASALWHVMRPARRALAVSFVALVITVLSPIDVFPGPTGHGLRVVPLVMGLPGEELLESEKRGEVVLGGCIVSGLEPSWVITW